MRMASKIPKMVRDPYTCIPKSCFFIIFMKHLLQVCFLCRLRGGALKPTGDDQYVHVICAMTVGNATFRNPEPREPILFGTTGEAPPPQVSYNFSYPCMRFCDILKSLGWLDHVIHVWG